MSSREKVLLQWHLKGRSPVCLRMCLARCSDRVKVILQSPYPVHWKILGNFVLAFLEGGDDRALGLWLLFCIAYGRRTESKQ